MTARVCPVHGEWCATGACRWCEPAPRCRCGEYAWEEPCPPDMREGVIGGVFHSEAQCFKLDATPPAEPVSLPGLKGLWQKPDSIEVNEAGVPTYTFTLTEKTADAYVWRLEGIWPVYIPTAADMPIQPPVVLEYQHAALRWERVARRWNYKHWHPGGLDEGERAYVWRCWLEQMALRREGNLIAAGIPKGWP